MTRILTAIGLILFAVYLVFFSPQPVFVAGALLVGSLCYLEFAGLLRAHQILKPGALGLALGFALVLFPSYSLVATSIWLIVQLVWLLRCKNLSEIATSAACSLFGAYYCFLPWRFAIDLRAASVHLVFFGLALNWIGDSSAFYVGRRLGKHKLAPVVSPAKSWEGAAASVVGSIVFGLIYWHYTLSAASVGETVVLATAGNVSGQLGDLVESSIKRGAGLKDSGTLLPGHGGALDRLDSSLFALPTVYVLGRLFHLC